jgi:UDP-GlcNAc:undecaprenyl-phosphate GlcNAc-1-phosphate transferase
VNWSDYLGVFLGSTFLSVIIVWAFKRLAHRFDITDKPDAERKLQAIPIPKLGGAGVVLALSGVLMFLTWIDRNIQLTPLLILLGPALLAGLIGLVDDLRPLSPWTRIILLSAVGVLLFSFGTQINFVNIWFIDLAVTIIWLIAITNALNMIDNTDGLAGSATAFAALGTGLVAAVFGQFLVSALSFAVAGAALGFLFHNWYPAKIYLGDTGSYFFGFVLAALTIRLEPVELERLWAWMIPILILILPITDLFFVVTRRISTGRHPFTAGRDHLAHELVESGLRVRWAVSTLLAFSLIGLSIAIILALSLR